jgi:hypothetical protein
MSIPMNKTIIKIKMMEKALIITKECIIKSKKKMKAVSSINAQTQVLILNTMICARDYSKHRTPGRSRMKSGRMS